VIRKCFRMLFSSCLVLVLLCTVVACDSGLAPGEELPSAEEIIEGVIEAQANLTTGRQDFDMDMTMNIAYSGMTGKVTMSMSGEIAADFSNRELEAEMSMSQKVSAEGQTQSIKGDILMYIIDDTEYTKMEMPGEYSGWQKYTLSTFELDEIWEAANYISAYADLLEDSDITVRKVQTVNGVRCYVVDVQPTMSGLANLIEQQELAADTGLPFDYSDMFKSFFVRYWIAKDSYDIIRATVEATLELEEAGYDISGSMQMTANGWDYGEPISIDVPAAALNAD